MAPASHLAVGASALLALGASAFTLPQAQAPLVPQQVAILPLILNDAPPVKDSEKLPLVDSWALQNLINKEALKLRAQELYDVAKLSEDEYNRPTRVIGSKGESLASRRFF